MGSGSASGAQRQQWPHAGERSGNARARPKASGKSGMLSGACQLVGDGRQRSEQVTCDRQRVPGDSCHCDLPASRAQDLQGV